MKHEIVALTLTNPYWAENTTVTLAKSPGSPLWRVRSVMGKRQAKDISLYLRAGEFKTLSNLPEKGAK